MTSSTARGSSPAFRFINSRNTTAQIVRPHRRQRAAIAADGVRIASQMNASFISILRDRMLCRCAKARAAASEVRRISPALHGWSHRRSHALTARVSIAVAISRSPRPRVRGTRCSRRPPPLRRRASCRHSRTPCPRARTRSAVTVPWPLSMSRAPHRDLHGAGRHAEKLDASERAARSRLYWCRPRRGGARVGHLNGP